MRENRWSGPIAAISDKIMIFDYQTLVTQIWRSIFRTRGTNRRITPARLRFFAIFSVLFLYGQISSWIGLALDHILYPAFRRIDMRSKTLFIVGNFRSGSTFLHRMLAADRTTFTALNTWEIYLAPSIVQRKFFRGVKIVDSWFGAPIFRRLSAWDGAFLQSVKLHSISLWKPEEDVGLLLYVWYGLFSWFFFPDWEPIEKIVQFDHMISQPRQKSVARFYAGCLKRHLYFHGTDRIVVSKNPSFSPLMRSLDAVLPDAKFVGLVRRPVDTVASTIGWLSFAWHFFADPIETFPFCDDVIEMVDYFYRSLRRAELQLPDAFRAVRFDQLIGNTESVVEGLYIFVGRTMSAAQQQNVRRETEEAQTHTPDIQTRLELIGLDPRWLAKRFHDTIDHYGFTADKKAAVNKTN